MKNKTSDLKGFSILLLGGFLYALYGVFSRMIGDSIPQFYQIWSRAVIIVILLYLIIFFAKISIKKIKKVDLPWAAAVGISAGLLLPFFYIAVNNLPIGTTIFCFYAVSTVISYLMGKFILGEKFTVVKIVSLVFAITGLFLMFAGSLTDSNLKYLLYAGIAGAMFGINIISINKINTRYPTLQVNLFNWVGGFIVSIVVSLFIREPLPLPELNSPWFANFGLALCSLAASFSVIFGFKFIEVQKGSIILLSELIFGVLLGLILYNEVPTTTTFIGSVLVFVALVIPNLNILRGDKAKNSGGK